MRNLGRRLREAKGPRAFAFEVLVVVVGVLIALGAQQLVDDFNWSRKVRDVEIGLREELDFTIHDSIEQLVTAPCVLAQIDSARARVLDRERSFQPLPVVKSQIGPHAIRAPSRNLTFATWTAAVGDGTVSRMAPRRRRALTQFYTQAHVLDNTMSASELQRSRLLVLTDRIEFDSQTRYAVLRDLAELRAAVAAQQLIAGQMLGIIRDIGWMPASAVLAEWDNERAQPLATSALCRQRELPLGNWRAQLAAVPPEY